MDAKSPVNEDDRVPTAPRHIFGVTSLRGRLLTVVDLAQMLGHSFDVVIIDLDSDPERALDRRCPR